jgi:hypothetical protein
MFPHESQNRWEADPYWFIVLISYITELSPQLNIQLELLYTSIWLMTYTCVPQDNPLPNNRNCGSTGTNNKKHYFVLSFIVSSSLVSLQILYRHSFVMSFASCTIYRSLNITILRDVTPCSPAEVNGCFGGKPCSSLKIEEEDTTQQVQRVTPCNLLASSLPCLTFDH